MSRDLLAMACLTQDLVYREIRSFAVFGAEPGAGSEPDE